MKKGFTISMITPSEVRRLMFFSTTRTFFLNFNLGILSEMKAVRSADGLHKTVNSSTFVSV